MSTYATLDLKCDQAGCKNKISVEGVKATKNDIYAKSRKAGWVWKSASKHLCPTHKPTATKPVTKKAVSGKAGKAKSGKSIQKIAGAAKVKLPKKPLGELLNLDNPSAE